MLKIPRQNFEKFRNLLLRKQKEVEEELKNIEKEDPLMGDALLESSESGTDSWIAEGHTRVLAVKQNLQQLLSKIKYSLSNLTTGKYGKCEKCGKAIEPKRLQAMPVATLCASCAKKYSK